jgi:hypothetical protein
MSRVLRVPLPRASARLGRTVHLALREPSAGEFFTGAPDVFPDTACFAAMDPSAKLANLTDQVRWADSVIQKWAICAHEQPMAGACTTCGRAKGGRVQLGEDRDHVVMTFLREWRYEELDKKTGDVSGMPGKNGRSILRAVAKRSGRLPHELWDLPVSDLMFDYRIYFERDAELLKQREEKKAARFAMNDSGGPEFVAAEELGIDVG